MSNPRQLPSFAVLRAFEEFGRHGGIRRAAQHLEVDHAVISRHLRALEALIGTALIERRPGEDRWLTDDGALYHARIAAALREIGDATELLRSRNNRRLMIWSVPGFAFHWLTRRLANFSAAYPQIDVELRPSDRSPDFSTNEADADIRYVRGDAAEPASSALRSLEIARPLVFPVCSPNYLASIADRFQTPADLLDCRLLHEDDDSEWRSWLRAQGLAIDGPIAGPRLWHAHLSLDAARSGQGLALANRLLLGDDLDAGRLVVPQTSAVPLTPVTLGGYTLSARADRWRNVGLQRFREWLLASIPREI